MGSLVPSLLSYKHPNVQDHVRNGHGYQDNRKSNRTIEYKSKYIEDRSQVTIDERYTWCKQQPVLATGC